MALITLPTGVEILRPVWTPSEAVQVNKSAFNNARRVLDFDNGYFTASAEIMPATTETQKRKWRSFHARLRGPGNTFHLPASSCAQHAATNPRVSAPLIGNTFSVVAKTAVTANSITKNTGPDTTWNASAIRTGDGALGSGVAVTVRVRNLTDVFMIGFREAGNSTSSFEDMDFAIYQNANTLSRSLLGSTTAIGTVLVGDVLGLLYLDDTIYLFKNGAVVWEGATTAGRTFRFDTSFYTTGSAATDIGFGLLTPGAALASVTGLPVSATLIHDGEYATVPLMGGGEQIVILGADLAGDASGYGVLTFEPAPRHLPALGAEVETKNPYGLVALVDGTRAPDENNGVMTWLFEVEEAF